MARTVQLGRGGLTPGLKYLLIANTAAYLLSLLYIHWMAPSPVAGARWIQIHLALFPGAFFEGYVWELFTYMFLHAFGDPLHLIFNMFVLWMFGSIFEPQWGTRSFLFFYFACGLGGGIAVVLMALLFPSTLFFQAPVIGASAAVLGFVIAFAVRFPDSYVYLFFMLPIKARYIGIAAIVGDFLMGLAGMNIASQAHIGGMLTAYLLLTGYWRPSRLKTLKAKLQQEKRYRDQRKRFRDAMKQ